MRKLGFVLFAALSATSAKADDSCTLTRLASLDMAILPSGHLTVPITVAGADRNFLVEFDDADAAITKALADELKLEPQALSNRIRVDIADQRVLGKVALPDVQIGTVHGKDVDMYVIPQLPPDSSVAGTLGTKLLKSFDVELDFKSGKLNLYSPTACQGNTVYWAHSYAAVPFQLDRFGFVHFQMQLDGKPLDVTIDTDSEHGRMGTTAAKTLFGIESNSPDLKPVRGSSNEAASYIYPFKSLSVGDVAIYNPMITLDPDTADAPDSRCRGQRQAGDYCFGGSDLRIGLAELRLLRAYFSFRENMLYVTAADAHK